MSDLDTYEVGAIKRQPINRNFLSQLDFKFLLHRAPHVTFFLQRVNIPGINLTPVNVPNPFVDIPYSGEHIRYQPLGIEFKIDEDFKNYFEIHNWIKALGYPENFGQYGEIAQKEKEIIGEGIRSDISLMILSSTKSPNIEIIFHDCIPTSLSDLNFSTKGADVDYIEALATFAYTWYDVEEI